MMSFFILIPVFLICAAVMGLFAKALNRFLNYVLSQDPEMKKVRELKSGRPQAEEPDFELTPEMYLDIPEDPLAGEPAFLAESFSEGLVQRLLDKRRLRSKVIHSTENNVHVGSARPTQVRIHPYE